MLGWVGVVVAVVLAGVLLITPAALDQRLDEVERIVGDLFDGRTAFDRTGVTSAS